MANGFNHTLHKNLDLLGTTVKGYTVLKVAEVRKTNIRYLCVHNCCNTRRIIFGSELCAKSDRNPVCRTCTPKCESYTNPKSKFYPFYKLFKNIHAHGKRSEDFSSFYVFMDFITRTLLNAFSWKIDLKLRKRNKQLPHSFTNTLLILTHPDGTKEEFSGQDIKADAI